MSGSLVLSGTACFHCGERNRHLTTCIWNTEEKVVVSGTDVIGHMPAIAEGGRRCTVLVAPYELCNLLDYEHPAWVADNAANEASWAYPVLDTPLVVDWGPGAISHGGDWDSTDAAVQLAEGEGYTAASLTIQTYDRTSFERVAVTSELTRGDLASLITWAAKRLASMEDA